LDVPQDLPETVVANNSSPANADAGDVNDIAIADLNSSVPHPLVSENGGQRTFLEPQPQNSAANNVATGPKVPDFSNETMRQVVEESSRLGVPVDFTGAGLARAQYPAPGSFLASGERVRVRFGP
ncbi:MAG: PASTA domain-containing protein, partial [Bryobacteraceae bacterium]